MVRRRKDGKRVPKPWTCPKCQRVLKQAGRHQLYCDGTAKPVEPKPPKPESNGHERRPMKGSRHGQVTVTTSSDYTVKAEAFRVAYLDMMETFKAMHTELAFYKMDRDEKVARLERFEALRGLFK